MNATDVKKLVDNTIARANEMSDAWTGTTTGSIIDSRKKHVESLMSNGDMNLVSIAVLELAEVCAYAEKELNGYETR